MYVPLCRDDNYLGCVYLCNTNVTGLFTEELIKIAQILSVQASILIENAYLMGKYKRLNKSLENKVLLHTRSIREKNKQLSDTNIKLINTERMKDILTSTIVHDIKNYAFGISGGLKSLKKSFKEDSEMVNKRFSNIDQSCKDIFGLSSNLLDIGKMDEGIMQINCEQIEFEQITSYIHKYSGYELLKEKNIAIEIDKPVTPFSINADPYLLARIIENLLNNAAKYSSQDGIVRVWGEHKNQERQLYFFNTGNPIPAEYREKIFNKYTSVDEKRSMYSKGLGLYFCKMVMDAHDGRIWLETEKTGNSFNLAFKAA
jgi:K+-sensing histidine kinase KdpD